MGLNPCSWYIYWLFYKIKIKKFIFVINSKKNINMRKNSNKTVLKVYSLSVVNKKKERKKEKKIDRATLINTHMCKYVCVQQQIVCMLKFFLLFFFSHTYNKRKVFCEFAINCKYICETQHNFNVWNEKGCRPFFFWSFLWVFVEECLWVIFVFFSLLFYYFYCYWIVVVVNNNTL